MSAYLELTAELEKNKVKCLNLIFTRSHDNNKMFVYKINKKIEM